MTKTDNHAKAQAEATLDHIVQLIERKNEAYDLFEATENSDSLDAVTEEIEQDALSLSVRSDWQTIGEELKPAEYEILLATGGPAIRITGELGEKRYVLTAHLEYQDWYTPWTQLELTGANEYAVLEYARNFYLGG